MGENMQNDFNEEQSYYGRIDYCNNCGQYPIDKSESNHSVLCNRCRNEMIKYPIPKIFILLGIVILGLIVFSLLELPKDLKDFKIYRKAEDKISEGKVNEALDDLEKLIKKYPDSDDMPMDAVKYAMENGKYSYAIDIINNSLYGKELMDVEVEKIESYYDILEPYRLTENAYYKILEELDYSLSYEEQNNSIKNSLLALEGDVNQYKPLLYYLIGVCCTDYDEASQYLVKSLSLDGNLIESRIELAKILICKNQIDEAEVAYNAILKKESDNYEAKSNMAVVYLLKGDNKKAVELAYEAYELCDPKEYCVSETLIVALSIDGQADKAQQYINELKELGYDLNEDAKRLIDNQISLEQYYIG